MSSSGSKDKDSENGTYCIQSFVQCKVLKCLLIVEMAGAMMIERAQSIPAMESIDPKEYLAK